MSATSLRSPAELATVNQAWGSLAALFSRQHSRARRQAQDADQLLTLAERYDSSSPGFADDLRAAANRHLGNDA